MQRKYQWEEWFGRPCTVLLRGIHYNCSQSAMCQSIRNNASRRGVRVSLVDTGTEIILEVKGGEKGGDCKKYDKGQTISNVRGDVPGEPLAAAGA